MEHLIEEYLMNLSKELKYVDEAEKKDILEEVENHFYEKIENGATAESIIKGFGTPKELAKAYDGKSLVNTSSFNIKGLLNMIKHYSILGVKGTLVISFVGSLTIAFYLGSFLILLAAIIKIIGGLMGFDLPLITFDIGLGEPSTTLSIIVSLVLALLMYLGSKKMWVFLKDYILKMTKSKPKI